MTMNFMCNLSCPEIIGGFYEFYRDTRIFSLSKKKWLQGPEFPHLRGVEEGCATLISRHVVMIIGMTKVIGNLRMILSSKTVSGSSFNFHFFFRRNSWICKN